MKKEKYAKAEAIKIFSDFINNKIDTDTLIFKLNNLEIEIKAEYKYSTIYKNLWFRFFKDYPSATTIRDIKQYLLYSTSRNKEYIKECIEIAVNEKSLSVYFS